MNPRESQPLSGVVLGVFMGPEVRHGEEVYPRVDARLGNSEAAITLTHGCTNPAGVLGRAAIRPGFGRSITLEESRELYDQPAMRWATKRGIAPKSLPGQRRPRNLETARYRPRLRLRKPVRACHAVLYRSR